MLYLGWIAAAFMGGYLFCCWYKRQPQTAPKKQPSLYERLCAVDQFTGKRYDEILRLMRFMPQKTSHDPSGQIMRTWAEAGYSITLGFDHAGVCVGVMEEQLEK